MAQFVAYPNSPHGASDVVFYITKLMILFVIAILNFFLKNMYHNFLMTLKERLCELRAHSTASVWGVKVAGEYHYNTKVHMWQYQWYVDMNTVRSF